MQQAVKMVVPKIKMNNGLEIPVIGLGTWKVVLRYSIFWSCYQNLKLSMCQSKPGEVKQAVIDAINAGYTHIDCAHVYQNENEVGAALKEKISDGTITRNGVFITSKV